jgi:hypothetical protein
MLSSLPAFTFYKTLPPNVCVEIQKSLNHLYIEDHRKKIKKVRDEIHRRAYYDILPRWNELDDNMRNYFVDYCRGSEMDIDIKGACYKLMKGALLQSQVHLTRGFIHMTYIEKKEFQNYNMISYTLHECRYRCPDPCGTWMFYEDANYIGFRGNFNSTDSLNMILLYLIRVIFNCDKI